MGQTYRLNADKSISPCNRNEADWDTYDRIVGVFEEGNTRVSTVFMPNDLYIGREPHKPVVFETMVFGGEFDGDIDRYESYEEALYGHKAMVEKVKGGDLYYRVDDVREMYDDND